MAGIVNLLTKALISSPTVTTTAPISARSKNPFAPAGGNPFVNSNSSNPFATYGQNRPVAGGYFAGYYNNQPNIVGRRLFIEA